MSLNLNREIAAIVPSASMVTMAKAKKLKAVDAEIVDLAGGEPDFDTPKKICDELFRQINAGYTHYTVGNGLPELREKIAAKLRTENGCAGYDADSVIVTPGGKYAIYAAVRALVNPGDEVMYLTPGWVSYPAIAQAAAAVSVAVPLDPDGGYRITEEALEAKVTSKTRLLIVNYPNNPTGRVLTRPEAEILRGFMLRHPDVVLLSDEMYEKILFDGNENISPASCADIAPRVVTVNGFSKCVAMTGWRIGYMAASPGIVKVAGKLFQHTISCTSGFIQKAAAMAFKCGEEIEAMRRTYQERRDFFVGGLNAVPGVHCEMPEGAFYAWTKFDLPGMDSNQGGEYILNNAKVVGVPGVSYGEEKGCWMRFSFATDDAQLRRAVENIARMMKGLRK
ncbi:MULTISPECIES: pyridoxal phosphate-dependent aminotransferase [unclassified Pyramidobacter]|uniref:pyridoxal phosphate-dependent aminotransferase n=1 Tax=unclassified Pyramidobacter TaxID=2632171 RepID=UPI000EA09715|nr:pyridoxal phosphate-dependent aminotransferase [Pyramidobacter sp. CG50-2]RKJ76125.1 pyridoxal phosphate-dependent aminotransferase [Pyramidobacter sp. CG50-2]